MTSFAVVVTPGRRYYADSRSNVWIRLVDWSGRESPLVQIQAFGDDELAIGRTDTLTVEQPGLYEPIADVEVVREYLNPSDHTSAWSPDFDYEGHLIQPRPGQNQRQLIRAVVQAAESFHGHDPRPQMDIQLWDNRNRATFVNSLLAALGYPEGERHAAREFVGVDWGEENLIDASYFAPVEP